MLTAPSFSFSPLARLRPIRPSMPKMTSCPPSKAGIGIRFMKPMAIEISATNSKKALTPAVSALPAMPAMPTGPERFSVLTSPLAMPPTAAAWKRVSPTTLSNAVSSDCSGVRRTVTNSMPGPNRSSARPTAD